MAEKEKLERKIKSIVDKHLKQMVADVEWELLISIDDYDKTIHNVFAEKLYQCFLPFVKLKTTITSESKKE